jgi:GT2 family glycosyltransferase
VDVLSRAARGVSEASAPVSTTSVSVIVPVRDDAERLRALLELLGKQTLEHARFEVLVGDDGSAHPPTALTRPDGLVRVLPGPALTSYGARNRAAAAATGDVLAFCDCDCVPEPGWLDAGLEALGDADLAAGAVVFAPPERPTSWSLLTVDMFLDQERNVLLSRAVTANLFVRRNIFERLGGFDETLPSGGDYEFVERAVEAGSALVYAPAAVVRHPTLDSRGPFLHKIWMTNHWSAVRRARAGRYPLGVGIGAVVPVLGVALARRKALRSPWRLQQDRLATAGLSPSRGESARALALVYVIVGYVAGFARLVGYLRGRRARTGGG